jgi:hypothetical protein
VCGWAVERFFPLQIPTLTLKNMARSRASLRPETTFKWPWGVSPELANYLPLLASARFACLSNIGEVSLPIFASATGASSHIIHKLWLFQNTREYTGIADTRREKETNPIVVLILCLFIFTKTYAYISFSPLLREAGYASERGEKTETRLYAAYQGACRLDDMMSADASFFHQLGWRARSHH